MLGPLVSMTDTLAFCLIFRVVQHPDVQIPTCARPSRVACDCDCDMP